MHRIATQRQLILTSVSRDREGDATLTVAHVLKNPQRILAIRESFLSSLAQTRNPVLRVRVHRMPSTSPLHHRGGRACLNENGYKYRQKKAPSSLIERGRYRYPRRARTTQVIYLYSANREVNE